jgi:hypothetical protein
MHTRIDPAILGGVVARVGDQVIDGSIRNRLHVLQQQLLAGISSSNADFAPEDFAADENDEDTATSTTKSQAIPRSQAQV